MSESVLISIISGVTSITMAIITVVIKTWLDGRNAAKKAAEDETIHAEDLGEMIYIQEYVEKLRDEFQFDRVAICQFHNGGKFFNGRSMKKFSMTYEATALGIEKIKRNYQNVLVSEFPKMVAAILEKDFFIVDASNAADYPQMWREMIANGIVQSVKVPIRGLRGDIMGFITCHSIGDANDLVGQHLRHDFVDRANQISGYLLK
jgi:hypothetical protein